MKLQISDRILNMVESPIRKLLPYANSAKEKGIKVYPLNIGQPDIMTPKEYFQAIGDFKEEVLSYADSKGRPELLETFSRYFKKNNIDFNEEDIVVTNGGSEALLFAFLALCNQGEHILTPEPFYANYKSFASLAGVDFVPITTNAQEGFALPDKEAITRVITDKTRAILLTNPSNPTGKVYSLEEMKLLSEIALEYDLFIISDEVYKEFTYDGLKFNSFAQFHDIKDRVVIIDSISKRYSACGARIGCLATKNEDLQAQFLKLAQSRLSVSTLDQVGAAKLIEVEEDYFKETAKEYEARRDVLYNGLQEIDGVICKKPTGAFYVVAKLPVKDSEEFAIWLLENFNLNNETILITPAENFYATKGLGKDEVRISYCINKDELKKAMAILKEALNKYPNKI